MSKWWNKRGKTEPIDPAWPAWYRDYVAECQVSPLSDGTPLKEVNVRVIDAETTGLIPKKDHLLSLGGLEVKGGTIFVRDHFEAYLPTPRGYSDRGGVSIHGILPNSLRYTYDREDELLVRLLRFLGPDGLIVGHHIGFDLEVINLALARQGAGPLRNRVIDTASLAERVQASGYWTPPQTYGLDSLARRYNIPLSDRHTALGDAYITAILWLKLTNRLRDKIGRDLLVGDL
jgi:DNA polymerase-3 subunit epsilon